MRSFDTRVAYILQPTPFYFFVEYMKFLAPILLNIEGALVDLPISLTDLLRNLLWLSESTSMTTKWHHVSPNWFQMIPKWS